MVKYLNPPCHIKQRHLLATVSTLVATSTDTTVLHLCMSSLMAPRLTQCISLYEPTPPAFASTIVPRLPKNLLMGFVSFYTGCFPAENQ